jgi:hypothetical protein
MQSIEESHTALPFFFNFVLCSPNNNNEPQKVAMIESCPILFWLYSPTHFPYFLTANPRHHIVSSINIAVLFTKSKDFFVENMIKQLPHLKVINYNSITS